MSLKLRTIRIYGKIGVKYGRVHKLAVATAAEAIRALCVNFPGFEADLMQSKDKGIAYVVLSGKRELKQDQLTQPAGNDDIRIAPVIMGSKSGGFINILLGAVLVFIGFAISGFSFGTLTPIGSMFVGMGLSMIAGGVVQLLSPQPKAGKPQEAEENTPNYSFSGPVNTTAQGHCVPVLIGELIVGSAVISAGITAKDGVFVPADGGAPPPGNGTGPSGGGGSAPWHLDFTDPL